MTEPPKQAELATCSADFQLMLSSNTAACGRLRQMWPPSRRPHDARARLAALSTVWQTVCLPRERYENVNLQALSTLACRCRKKVPDGFRGFSYWWPFDFGLLCLACQSQARREEE